MERHQIIFVTVSESVRHYYSHGLCLYLAIKLLPVMKHKCLRNNARADSGGKKNHSVGTVTRKGGLYTVL